MLVYLLELLCSLLVLLTTNVIVTVIVICYYHLKTHIIGLVLNVVFSLDKILNIYNALVVKSQDIIDQQINMTYEI